MVITFGNPIHRPTVTTVPVTRNTDLPAKVNTQNAVPFHAPASVPSPAPLIARPLETKTDQKPAPIIPVTPPKSVTPEKDNKVSPVVNDYESERDTKEHAELVQNGEIICLAMRTVLDRADIPVTESELEFMYNEATELGQDCYKAQLGRLGFNNLHDLLIAISDEKWDEGLTVCGIRMNRSRKTLDGSESLFYYSDIDGGSNHDWLVDEDYYSEQMRDGTLERWVKQIVSIFNNRVKQSSVEKAESYLRQKWETR